MVSEIAINVLPETVYCCSKQCRSCRPTLFTTMFTVIIVVCLLKRICMPSFVLICCCMSELHGHVCPYCDVLPEAVYCCFTRTTVHCFSNCLHVCMIRVIGYYHVTKFRYSTPSSF